MAYLVHSHTANNGIFYEFNDLAVSLAEDTLTWFALDSAQIARMWELAESPYDVAIHAQAVLGLVLDTIFNRTPEPLPFALSGKMVGQEPETEVPLHTSTTQSVKVFPNPFSNSFNVEYALEKEANELMIEVFDLMGRSVRSTKLDRVQNGIVTIDLAECLGIYVLRMTADGKRVHNQKVVCLQR